MSHSLCVAFCTVLGVVCCLYFYHICTTSTLIQYLLIPFSIRHFEVKRFKSPCHRYRHMRTIKFVYPFVFYTKKNLESVADTKKYYEYFFVENERAHLIFAKLNYFFLITKNSYPYLRHMFFVQVDIALFYRTNV